MAEVVEKEIELFPEAAKMPLLWATLFATEKIIIHQGGTSSGKSQGIIRYLFILAIFNPGIKIEVVGATVPKLTGDTLEIAEGIADRNPHVKAAIKRYNLSTHTFYFKNGSKMLFKSYEKAKDADGPKRDILYISEARNFEWPCAYQLIKRTKHKVIMDYNPVAAFWAHDKIINCPINPKSGKKEFPSVKVIRSWHIHNHFISEEMHDSIENISDKELWKAYARGLTAQVSGLVYPNFVKTLHPFPVTENVVWGIDFGYTNDPTAIVKVAIDQVLDGVHYDYVVEEISYEPGIPPGMIKQLLVDAGYKFGQPVYIDHDSSMQRDLRALRVVAVKAIKDIDAGILHLRTKKVAYTTKCSLPPATGECSNIEYEKRRYSFSLNDDGTNSNKPEDRYNHCCDSIRYACFTHSVRRGLIKGYKYSGIDEEEKQAA